MFIKPPLHLSPYIKEIWTWGNVNTDALPWILPSFEIELVIHLSEPPSVVTLSGDTIALSQFHWVGPQNRRWKIQSSHSLNLVSIRFQAGGPYELFNLPANEMINRYPIIEASHLPLFLPLHQRSLLDSSKTENESQSLESFFTNFTEYVLSRKTQIEPKTKFAFAELIQSNLSINEIGNKLGISRKQLERQMRKVYGFTPGELRKIHRILSLIRNPLNYKSENTDGRLTDIAYEFGYTDQSHLIHDFKSITGYLPKAWFKNFEKMSYFYNS